MIVLFWSRATRDLLKSFGWGIAGTPSIRYSDEVAILAARPIASVSPTCRDALDSSGANLKIAWPEFGALVRSSSWKPGRRSLPPHRYCEPARTLRLRGEALPRRAFLSPDLTRQPLNGASNAR